MNKQVEIDTISFEETAKSIFSLGKSTGYPRYDRYESWQDIYDEMVGATEFFTVDSFKCYIHNGYHLTFTESSGTYPLFCQAAVSPNLVMNYLKAA